MERCTSAICLPIQSPARPRAHIMDSFNRALPACNTHHVDTGISRALYFDADSGKLVSDSLMKRAEHLSIRGIFGSKIGVHAS